MNDLAVVPRTRGAFGDGAFSTLVIRVDYHFSIHYLGCENRQPQRDSEHLQAADLGIRPAQEAVEQQLGRFAIRIMPLPIDASHSGASWWGATCIDENPNRMPHVFAPWFSLSYPQRQNVQPPEQRRTQGLVDLPCSGSFLIKNGTNHCPT